MAKSLLLIDGNSIINRAYYGLAGRSTMTSADGTPTGALYAFLNIYLKHIQDLEPTYVCACFDLKGPTFRHLKYDKYKATRKPMPPDLVLQIPILKDIMDAMGIPRLEMEGMEADDLIGSLANYSRQLGWDTFILSGDKDDFQLVNEKTTVLMPIYKNGQTTTERFDSDAITTKYGIRPEQFIDLKAIMGDPSDNIPGVKGIGEKGATDLILQYHTLDKIYESLDAIKPAIAEKLRESKEIAYLSKWLATINQELPVQEFLQEIHKIEINKELTYAILQKLGFRSIIQRMQLSATQTVPLSGEAISRESEKIESTPVSIRKVTRNEWMSILLRAPLYRFAANEQETEGNDLPDAGKNDLDPYIGESMRTAPVQSDERGFLSFLPATEHEAIIDCGHKEYYLIAQSDYIPFFEFAKKEKIRIVSMDSKAFLRNERITPEHLLLFDVFVAGYLLSQAEGSASLERITEICLGHQTEIPPTPESEKDQVIQNKQQSLFEDSDQDKKIKEDFLIAKAAYDIAFMYRIAQVQYQQLQERGLEFLAIQVEMPLIAILADMERIGFAIDKNVLGQLNDDFTKEINRVEAIIYEQAGTRFNINSPKQLGEILFKKLMLPTGKKTQSGFSTNADVLDMLYDKHPIVKEIGTYRQLTKLRSTFIEGLSKNIDPADLRVHTTFNQTLTTTGRLSSSEPNLQNIPVKQEVGREIRKAFVASEGHVLVDADYSQIELRLLAEFSKDTEMQKAFRNMDDIHMNTAEEIFDLPRNMITPSMRSAAKTVNFSIVYGISDFGLAQDLGIPLKEAHAYISEYYKKYPGVKTYLERLVKDAYATGYVETLFHRRRNIHELKSANRNLRMFGERVAMNTPVQGTAADIIKIAMVLVTRKLFDTRSKARLILQIHDELILESPEEEAEQVAVLLKEAMESAVILSIPFIAEVKIGKSWYHTK